MARRKFQIIQLIINSPYEAPAKHWHYMREYKMFERRAGRRKAGYFVGAPGSTAFDDSRTFTEAVVVKIIDDCGIESLKIVEVV